MSFMQPVIEHGEYFEIETTCGTEIVPADVALPFIRPVNMQTTLLLPYLEGTPNDPDEILEPKTGWLARMSAPGYLDCTSWTAHETELEAEEYLEEMYGDDEGEE